MRLSRVFVSFAGLLLLISLSLYAIRFSISDEVVLKEKTPGNYEIRCYKRGNSGKRILLIGCIHGNEKAGILVSIKVLNEIFLKTTLVNTLLCIPTVNPDGNNLDTRTNSNKIDINRNFPAANWTLIDSASLKPKKKGYWGGTAPSSEMETKFILKIDSLFHPDVFIILHQFLDCVEYDGTGAYLAEFLSRKTGQKLLDDIGYPTEGSIGSYFGTDKQKEVITIEIPENPPDSLQQSIV